MTRFARTARAARGLRLRRARSFALARGLRPPARFAPLRGLACSPWGAAPRGPGPAPGAPRAAWGCASLAPDPLLCARLVGLSPALFAHSASPLAPGPLPLRGSAPARRARRRFAGPFRRLAPSGRSGPPRPRPSGRPPGSHARPLVRRCAAPRALAGPVWLRRPIRSGAGSLFGRPSSAPGRQSPARGPAGAPPARPLRGFGGGGLLPRGPARPFGPLVFGLRPPGLFAARPRQRGLAVRLSGGASWFGGFSPCLPPAPAAPRWGARGVREACSRGLRPPVRGRVFAALCPAPPGP